MGYKSYQLPNSPACRYARIAEWGIKKMKKNLLFIPFLILGLLEIHHYAFSQTKIPSKTLTLLYSNNLNGEIDPCPT
jgi:hypothetical protein